MISFTLFILIFFLLFNPMMAMRKEDPTERSSYADSDSEDRGAPNVVEIRGGGDSCNDSEALKTLQKLLHVRNEASLTKLSAILGSDDEKAVQAPLAESITPPQLASPKASAQALPALSPATSAAELATSPASVPSTHVVEGPLVSTNTGAPLALLPAPAFSFWPLQRFQQLWNVAWQQPFLTGGAFVLSGSALLAIAVIFLKKFSYTKRKIVENTASCDSNAKT